MGNESMQYSLRKEKDRIDLAKSTNDQLIDSVPPLEHGLNLRPMDKSKEIVPPLRYTFRGDIERIYDRLSNNAYPAQHKSITQKDFDKKMTKFKKNFRSHFNNKSTSEKTFLKPKKIFEELHRKTHFKAAYTIYLNYKSCLQDNGAKALRTEDDIGEEFRYRAMQDEPLRQIKSEKDLIKSYDANMQRTYEDFDIQTDDSVVAIQKNNAKTAQDTRQSNNAELQRNKVKSLSPDFARSAKVDFGGSPKTSQVKDVIDIMKTRQESNDKRIANLDSAKENFRSLRNKTKSALEHSNFLRRKHFKGDTLFRGEGKLFMNKGNMDNDTYNQLLVKPVVRPSNRYS